MKNILHLSHTDISSDSRILKELDALTQCDSNYSIYAIGVNDSRELHKTNNRRGFVLTQINLWSRRLGLLPDLIRHVLSLFEVIIKMTFLGIKSRPNIIHCHDTLVLPVGVIVKLFTNAKLVYDAHELESNRNGLSPFLGKLTFKLEKILWPFVDHLIVVSPSIEKWYLKNIGDKPVTIILNSPVFPLDVDVYNKNYLYEKFNIPSEKKIFLYIGIIGKGRGIESILKVFSKSEIKSHVVFLGFGDLVNKVIEYSEVRSNIHYHAAVPHKDVVPIAKSASVGLCLVENVSLSDYYCLPNKLFEYAFSEIPVLASNFPDIRTVIERYNLGAYTELDVESIAAAVNRIDDLEELPTIKIARLYELSWQVQAEKLNSLYANIF